MRNGRYLLYLPKAANFTQYETSIYHHCAIDSPSQNTHYTFRMAALRLNTRNLLKLTYSSIISRFFASKTATGIWGRVDKVVTTNDNKVFVAWHPTGDFPYEKSLPLPPLATTLSSSLIKDTATQNAMRAFGNKHPEIVRQELMAVTYTTKHRWFPRSRDKRAKKTPMDREYL